MLSRNVVRSGWASLACLATFAGSSVCAEDPPGDDVAVTFDGSTATFPKLQMSKEATLERGWDSRNQRWMERVIVAPFAERVKTQPWGTDAVAFLRQAIAPWPPRELTDLHPELAKAGDALLAQGCNEPLIRFFAAYWRHRNTHQFREQVLGISAITYYNSTDGEREIDAMQDATNALDDAGFPRAPLRLFAHEIARAWSRAAYDDRGEAWRAQVAAWTEKALSEGSYNAEDAAVFVGQQIRWGMEPRQHLPTLVAAVEKSSLPPWARDAVLGSLAIGAAWKERGAGWASSVTPDGWKGFAGNLSKAREYLQRSWEEEPSHPEVCALMLTVIAGGEGQRGDDPLLWLSRAVSIEADYPAAFSKWLWFHRPRWGGSKAEMLALGRACLEARRYDTNLPEIFVEALHDTAQEVGNWRTVTRIPWVSDGLVEIMRGELAEPSRAGEREKLQSLLATRAWLAGKFEVAQQAMKDVPNGELHLAALEEIYRFNTYPDFMLRDLAIYGTPAWDEFERAKDATNNYADSDYAAALTHYQAALSLAPKNSGAEKWLRNDVALAEFEVRFRSGDWTPVPLDLTAWRIRAGRFSNDPDGALVAHTDKDRRGFAWFQGQVGQSYELRGHFAAASGAKAPPAFGIGVRAHRTVAYEYLHFSCSPIDEGKNFESKLRDHFTDLEEGDRTPKAEKSPLRKDNEFLVRVTPSAVAFELNGKQAIPEFETSRYVRREFDGRIALVISRNPSETATRLTALEIRKIPGAK